jgi:Tol biopolymer transport system component/DNA-binding winged helix-turn-helix (wHTH) protein
MDFSASGPRLVRFGVFELDLRSGELRKAGARLNLPDQPLQFLTALLERPGQLVTRDELRQRLWVDETFVDFEHGLNAAVKRLRDTLGDSADTPRFIETVPRRGYRFIAPVSGGDSRSVSTVHGAAPAKTPSRLRWVAGAVGGLAVAALVVAGVLFLRSKNENRTAQPASFKQITFVGDAESPAVSPDGQFLAYVTGRPGDSKTIVQDLVSGRTLEVFRSQQVSDVEWSPDGSSILVSTESGVKIVPRLGGPPRVLPLTATRMSWSPDGSEIAGVAPGAKWLSLVNAATGKVRWFVLHYSITFPHDVDWSPAGDWILFVALDGGNRENLWIVKADGSGQRKLLEEESEGLSARWAPTGDGIYYVKGTPTQDLWKLPVDRESGQPTGPSVQLLSGLQSGSGFGVFRDGRRLVSLLRSDDSNLWLGTIEAGQNHHIQAKELTKGTLSVWGPRFSPDGTRIAYATGDAATSNIFVFPIDGDAPQQLTFMKSMNGGPVWSPDGRTIAFGSKEGGAAKVWQVPAGGGVPHSFANTNVSANTFMLAWAPGRDLLYHRPGNRNFFFLNPKTERESPLLEDDALGWIFDPSYSPDGQALVARWNRYPAGLYIIPLDKPGWREQNARRVAGPPTFGTIAQFVDAAPYRGKDIKLTAHVRTRVRGDNGGQCWLRVDRANAQMGFFDNMENRPIRRLAWSENEIVGKVDADANQIAFGCFLSGVGQMWLDDIQLWVRSDTGAWAPIAIKNPGFEDDEAGQAPKGWSAPMSGYTYRVVSESPYKGKRSLQISAVPRPSGLFVPIGWSPDGRYVYAHGRNDAQHIVMIPVEGGEANPFVTLPVPEGRTVREATIALDGRHIAFTVGESRSDVRIITNFDPSVR